MLTSSSFGGRKNMKIDQNRLTNFFILLGFYSTMAVVINNTIKEVGLFQQVIFLLVLAFFCYLLSDPRFRSGWDVVGNENYK